MVVGAKVCDLTEDLLWFVYGLYVGILTSPLIQYSTEKQHIPINLFGGCRAFIRLTNVFNFFPGSSISSKFFSLKSDSNMVFITGEFMDRIILLAYTFWSSTMNVMSLWSHGLVKSMLSCSSCTVCVSSSSSVSIWSSSLDPTLQQSKRYNEGCHFLFYHIKG